VAARRLAANPPQLTCARTGFGRQIIDADADPGDVLARSVLKTVHVVRFDSKTTTYDELIGMVYEAHKQNKAPFQSICFANHGPVVDPGAPGYNQWPIAADKTLDLRSVKDALDDFAPFLATLTAALQKTGMGVGASHIDFLACNLASACKGFIPALEALYGQDFRGSTDETGNLQNGGVSPAQPQRVPLRRVLPCPCVPPAWHAPTPAFDLWR